MDDPYCDNNTRNGLTWVRLEDYNLLTTLSQMLFLKIITMFNFDNISLINKYCVPEKSVSNNGSTGFPPLFVAADRGQQKIIHIQQIRI